MLRWLKTVVVSDEETARVDRVRWGPGRRARAPVYWPGGARHEGGASPVCGFCMERGKAGVDTVLRNVARGERERAERQEP
jgi:hypothetical protein